MDEGRTEGRERVRARGNEETGRKDGDKGEILEK